MTSRSLFTLAGNRQSPCFCVALDISVEAAGRRWDVKTVDLSPYGVKVALPASAIRPSEGTSVKLQLNYRSCSP